MFPLGVIIRQRDIQVSIVVVVGKAHTVARAVLQHLSRKSFRESFGATDKEVVACLRFR